jgi:outer membrane protein TolC
MNTAQPYLTVWLIGLISMAAPAEAQTTGDTRAVQLTLADAEARALDHNPTLAQTQLGTELADYGVLQPRTAYTPTFSASFEQRSQTAAGTSQLTDSGRFVHHVDHIREVARESTLTVVSVDNAVLRYEYGEAVHGFVAVFKTPDSARAISPSATQFGAADCAS